MSFYPALRKELMELARTHRLLIMAVVLAVFGLMSPLLAKLAPELIRLVPGGEDLAALVPKPTVADAIGQYVKNVSQFGLVLALLMSMGVIAQEKERGTAVLMLVKPLPRGTFLLSKFVALALAFLGCLLVAGLGAYYYTMLLFEAPDLGLWLALNGLMWLYLLVVVALTLLGSTLVKSQAAAAGVGVGALLVMGAIGAIPGAGQYLPAHLPSWGAALFVDPSLRYWPAFGISLGLVAACLVAAWIIFERQEL